MRILFSVRNPAYVRHYDSVLRRLASRGHTIDLVADGLRKGRDWPPAVEKLARDCRSIAVHWAPPVAGQPWFEFGTRIRQALYFLRFLRLEYRGMPMLLARAEAKAPRWVVRAARLPLVRTPRGVALVERVLSRLDQFVPPSDAIVSMVNQLAPDVIVVSPLIVLRTLQLDLLRVGQAAGVPTVFGVASWDHLSSKGVLWSIPDRVLLWNQVQADEAVHLHRVPRDRVRVTGAQLFDEWFDRSSARSREQFCAAMGLDPSRPYVLYVGSALFEGSPSEPEAVVAWVTHLRACADAGVRSAGILIRPHPRRAREWEDITWSAFPGVVMHQPGLDASDAAWRDDYFDGMRFASAVVGINTSAMVEASILGRPVLSVLLPEFASNQLGTVHFRYLAGDTGLLETSETLDEHVRQLGRVLAGDESGAFRSRRFAETFVRPLGLGVEATGRVALEIEAAAHARRPPSAAAGAFVRVVRLALLPLAVWTARSVVAARAALANAARKRR